MPKLENWSVGSRNEYDPPELRRPCLAGKVTGHHRKRDGTEIITSPIVGVEGELIKTESGTLYEVGEVDPAYEERFPHARQRLFDTYTVKVFAMNDCDWVAAIDLDSAKQCYAEWLSSDSVATAEADGMYDDRTELSDADMQRLQFTHDRDDPGECEAYGHTECSFADRLKEMIAEGQTFPQFFASTEY